jgi:DUF1680 family protein
MELPDSATIKYGLTLLLITFLIACANDPGTEGSGDAVNLVQDVYTEVPLSAIRPEGWLRHQLEIMKDGSTGRLDEIHPKISDDNGWLGGEGDGWEETPYWLDGAVPLAYLLDHADLKAKVLRYVNWTLDHQRASGYFGPITTQERENGVEITAGNCEAGEDWWPRMIMLKVLKQYYSATADERVIPFMTKYFHYQLNALDSCTIGKWTEWAASRGADNVMMVQWLYRLTGDRNLLILADRIDAQSYPWSEWLGNRDWVINAAAQQNHDHWMRRHAVNIGMALKAPAVNYQRTGDEHYLDALNTGWNDLMTLHGLPMGIFSGDEDLHGNDPTQGIELCSIVESMFSLEQIIAITGKVQYMDALERMTFNALPTQTTDDYNMKQYFQVANQVQVSRGVFDFSLPFDRGMNNVFGLRSGYTCCTSNMHQGWTKFACHLWYLTPDNGVAALEYAPSQLSVQLAGSNLIIREKTDYPFGEVIDFEIDLDKAVAFPFQLRIPSWCREATISLNGEVHSTESGGQVISINRTWNDGDKVSLRLPMEVATSNWGKNSRTIERGPLVYALKLGERWEKGNEPVEGDYYSIYPTDDWNYGLTEAVVKDPQGKSEVKMKEIRDPFIWNQEHAPVEILVPAKKIPGWKAMNGVAHQPVTDRNGIYKGEVDEEIKTITLIPYGCTKVRVVAFPVVP